ncbi:MAG: ABC transporter permease [Ruminococcus sp.]|nr:ABC transporter permease [Ruminococcus sp.]MDE6665648.1 ABC transporter permease [Ruminococcus sp.]
MKFINLLQKELKELINVQMILSLVVILAMLTIMGNVTKTAINDVVEESTNPKINISDRDDTDFTKSLIEILKSTGAEVTEFDTDGDDYAGILKKNDIKNLVILPEGFTETIEKNERPEVLTVSRMTSAATMSNISTGTSGAVALIQNCIANTIATNSGMTQEEFELVENPIVLKENTVVDDKSAGTSIDSIMNKIAMQNMILPIIVFLLIMMTSQSLISSISNEKIDKTLETLLSSPVSRTSIITAKMLAAAVVALINAAVYMVGFSGVIKNSSADATEALTSGVLGEYISVDDAIAQLGLSLSVGDYILVGLQLFLTIMICLSVSIMLGALVNDTKSSQSVIMPIMMLAMVPYIISMLADINTLPMIIRILVYAIPFTHTFSGISNLMFGNNTIFIFGLIYQTVVFFICMFFALKLFNSDKILTISLNFGQKSKYNRKKSKNKD